MENMLYEGLGYFTFLTGVNVFSMIKFMSDSPSQSAGGLLNNAFTWIMTQRLLIDLNEATIARRARDRGLETVTHTNANATSRDISRVLPTYTSHKEIERTQAVDLQVKIEKTRTRTVDVHDLNTAHIGTSRARRAAPVISAGTEGTGSEWNGSDWSSEDSYVPPPRDWAMTTLRP